VHELEIITENVQFLACERTRAKCVTGCAALHGTDAFACAHDRVCMQTYDMLTAARTCVHACSSSNARSNVERMEDHSRAVAQGGEQDRFHARRLTIVDAHDQLHEQLIIERLSPRATVCDRGVAAMRHAIAELDDELGDDDLNVLDVAIRWLEDAAALSRAQATAAAHYVSPQ